MKENEFVDYLKYFIVVDPYDNLNWWCALLKKTGLFYKNRPKSSCGLFVWEKGDVKFKQLDKL